ncbi:unnamed protein product [Closterium sp. NIES-65]|nr:unnamed protein product [Closterium sp. NIES-65]
MHAVGRQLAVQKVLDVRFHPRGHPQLVIGCNEAPNELLLFDLSSGSHRPLQGHACQIQAVECAMDDHAIIFPIALLPCIIQAVEYAMDGDVILSCGGCTLKPSHAGYKPTVNQPHFRSTCRGNHSLQVWDSTSALLLHSCGPGVAATATATATASGNPSIACHRDKIRALAVNQKMSCGGDGGVALFDSRMHKAITRFSLGGSFEVRGIRGARGREVRGGDGGYREGWRCGFLCFAHAQGCLSLLPREQLRGDVSSVKPVTSAAFSPCGRFFHAACSANCCFLFDSRCLPSSSSSAAAPPSSSSAPPSSSSCPSPSLRALFCLSHGPPMPSVQHSVQHAGFVDYGDEGVNDARWLSASPGLVTASGNGSVAVWDVSLADPLTAFSFAHTRSINTVKQSTCLADKAVALASPSLHGRWRGHPVTPALPFEASQKPFLCSSSPSLHDQVAVAPDDACIATEGDDQKVVSAFLSPLLLGVTICTSLHSTLPPSGPPSLSFDRLFNLDSLEAHTSPCLVALLQHANNYGRINSPGDDIHVAMVKNTRKAGTSTAASDASCDGDGGDEEHGDDAKEHWPENGHNDSASGDEIAPANIDEDEWWNRPVGSDDEVEEWRAGDSDNDKGANADDSQHSRPEADEGVANEGGWNSNKTAGTVAGQQ